MPPDLQRKPTKFNCLGLDLTHPVDMMPEGYFPYLTDVRSIVDGTVEVRPGYSALNAAALNSGAPIHSIRRVNNLLPGAASPAQIFAGTGTSLYAGPPDGSAFVSIDSGYSGNPLSWVIFRPDQSPESWIYIADQNKSIKANCEQIVRNVGIAPPTVAPVPDIASVGGVAWIINNGVIDDGNFNTGWSGGGTGGAVAVNIRVPTSTTVADILYDTGSNGWCLMSPENLSGSYGFLQPGCRLIITGAGGPETVTVTEVHDDIPDTTIAGIIYDAGSTGLCSIALATQTPQLDRNSLLLLGVTSIVRVLSVTVGPDGLSSFRCNCLQTHVAGEIVRSVVSFRCYTTISIPSTGGIPDSPVTITGNALEIGIAAGTGYATKTQSEDLSLFASVNGSNRPLQPDDYMHISLRFDVPGAISSGRLMLDVDPVTNDFTQNFYYKEFRQSDLQSAASGTLTTIVSQQTAIQNQIIDTTAPDTSAVSLQIGTGTAQWTELFVKLADLVRVGTNQGVNLANVAAIRVELTVTTTVIMDFAAWWAAGSYGPDVQQGSPEGIQYRYRYRDTRTGAKSVPGPTCRYQLFPLRQSIDVLITASTDPQVNIIDVEKFDPSFANFVYIGSAPNITGTFADDTQASLIAGNPGLETNVFQPWPVLDTPKSGVVNVAGTSVSLVSGDNFQTSLIPGTVIVIGNDVTQLYGQPSGTTFLEITANLGALTNAAYSIASPVLLGQSLPVIFGPMEGPTAAYSFAIGDPRNPGTLYWSNGNDLDSASDQNTIEITAPTEPLVSGCVWQTLVFVASAKRVFLVTPGFGTDAKGNSTVIFTSTELTPVSGSFSSWGMTKGPQGVYMIGRDGLYWLNYNQGMTFSQQIYPLFPHDGEAAVQTNSFNPVLMTDPQHLRLNYCDASLMFDYYDSAGNPSTFRITTAQISSGLILTTTGSYWPHIYADPALTHYWEEVPQGTEPRMLTGTVDGFIMVAGGTTDNGTSLNGVIRTPSMDFGDPRSLKLFMDEMTDVDSSGGYAVAAGLDNYSVVVSLGGGGALAGRQQYLNSISSVLPGGLVLYRNIAAQYVIGAGSILYEFEPSYYLQPFKSNFYTTQLMDHGIPGWKQLRFGRIALISGLSPVTIQILNDDSVELANFTVPVTSGILFNDFVQLPHAAKGRLLRYSASSESEFVLFTDKTYVRIKKWGGRGFLEVQPFLQ